MSDDVLTDFFRQSWDAHSKFCPSAGKFLKHFNMDESSALSADHIALRTLNNEALGIEQIRRHFESLGYRKGGDYTFESKNLQAIHLEHSNPVSWPKIFVSELIVDKLSEKSQKILTQVLLENSFEHFLEGDASSLYMGRFWDIKYSDYKVLAKESEYAAWFYTLGFIPNHFTFDIDKIEGIGSIFQMNETLKSYGYNLNTSGGEVKGSDRLLLEQSSLMADQVSLKFEEGAFKVPGCFLEFVARYRNKNDEIFQGFIESSADKIFNSTGLQKARE